MSEKYPWIYAVKRLVVNERAGEWCQRPYPGHKRGCPNFGKAIRCPPTIGGIACHFDLNQPFCLVHSEFDIERWVAHRKEERPSLSDRQARCVLYWQNQSRVRLKWRIRLAMATLGISQYTSCPEGMGVNVYATARLAGLHLEKIRRLKVCRHVALLGTGQATE